MLSYSICLFPQKTGEHCVFLFMGSGLGQHGKVCSFLLLVSLTILYALEIIVI